LVFPGSVKFVSSLGAQRVSDSGGVLQLQYRWIMAPLADIRDALKALPQNCAPTEAMAPDFSALASLPR